MRATELDVSYLCVSLYQAKVSFKPTQEVIMRKEYLVTLNEEAMEEKRDGKDVDVLAILGPIPTMDVVSGAGTVSVHVSVDEEHVPMLMERAAIGCVVDVYGGLEPMPVPREFYE